MTAPRDRRGPGAAAARVRLALALALAGLGAGCGAAGGASCPGRAIGTFTTRAASATATCGPASGDCGATFPDLPPLTLTVSVDPAGGPRAWLCNGRRLAEPLVGTLAGDALDVASPAPAAAVLQACGSACEVTLSERVTGTVARGTGGEVVGFDGTLVDAADRVATVDPASCGTCGTPTTVAYPLLAP